MKPTIVIEYCPKCNWLLRAAYIAQELLTTFNDDLKAVALQPSEINGSFHISIDGNKIFDRKDYGGFPEIKLPATFKYAEAAIFSAYPFDKTWIGERTPLSARQLRHACDDVLLLRYAGDIDSEVLQREGIRYFPDHVHSGHMGVLPSAVGYDPIIRLQAGGLKAAEALMTGEYDHDNVPVVEVI